MNICRYIDYVYTIICTLYLFEAKAIEPVSINLSDVTLHHAEFSLKTLQHTSLLVLLNIYIVYRKKSKIEFMFLGCGYPESMFTNMLYGEN